MKTSLAILAAINSAAFAAEPAQPETKIAQIDKLVPINPIEGSALSPQWKPAKGKWEITDGVLRGSELKADNHGGVIRTAQ